MFAPGPRRFATTSFFLLISLPGFYRALWDGRDDSGRRVASGVYHARLGVNGRALGKRLTLLK